MHDEHTVQHDQVVVVVVLHDSSQIQHNVVVKQHQIQHIRVKQENIYQRIVQHVVHVHVDIIVQDEISLRVQRQISESSNVEHENGQVHEQQVQIVVEI